MQQFLISQHKQLYNTTAKLKYSIQVGHYTIRINYEG